MGESSLGGRVYLRKYQASSAMMSSSRDRTSTVGRMCWLGVVTSSEEKGEAEPGGQGAPSTKRKEEGCKDDDLYKCMCAAAFMCFEPCEYAVKQNQNLAQQHTSHGLSWPQA